MIGRTLTVIVAALIGLSACGGTAPQPPVVTPPGGTETVNGSERIGWDQRAGDAVELASIRYAIYVDGTRSELGGVTCAAAATGAGYAYSARLPAMGAGIHTLEIASFVQDGAIFESARSAGLRVSVSAGH